MRQGVGIRKPTSACPNREQVLAATAPPTDEAKAIGFARLANRPRGFVASSNCDYYLAPSTANPAGSNSNPGTLAAPWKTLASKTGLMIPGTVVCFRGGTWTDWSPLDWSNISNVTLAAYNCEEPLLWNSGKNIGDFIILRSGNDGITVSGLRFKGGGHPTVGTGAIEIGPSNSTRNQNIVVEDSSFEDIGADQLDHSIYLGGSTPGTRNVIIRRNHFLNGLGAAIQFYHPLPIDNVLIQNNEVTNMRWGVVIAHEGHSNITIDHNSFYGASDGAVHMAVYAEAPAAVSGITITNNIASGLTGGNIVGVFRVDKVFVDDGFSSRVNEANNNWYRAGTNPIQYGGQNPTSTYLSLASYQSASGEGASDLSVDPKFANVSAGNLRLTPSSPAGIASWGPRYNDFPCAPVVVVVVAVAVVSPRLCRPRRRCRTATRHPRSTSARPTSASSRRPPMPPARSTMSTPSSTARCRTPTTTRSATTRRPAPGDSMTTTTGRLRSPTAPTRSSPSSRTRAIDPWRRTRSHSSSRA